jgi:multimeric flavodoxin WrbA
LKVIAVNGSPRKNHNTATLLINALEGAKANGAQVEMIHLMDLKFTGCRSCFACKKLEGASYGVCAVADDLTEVFSKIRKADALIVGTPVYFFDATGLVRNFLERLWYPNYTYDEQRTSLFPNKIRTALVVSMNKEKEDAESHHFSEKFNEMVMFMEKVFGESRLYQCYNTYQFDDYSKYYAPIFPVEKKEKQRRDQFPKDCNTVYEIGQWLTEGNRGKN